MLTEKHPHRQQIFLEISIIDEEWVNHAVMKALNRAPVHRDGKVKVIQ
jgi:hypothetical protein